MEETREKIKWTWLPKFLLSLVPRPLFLVPSFFVLSTLEKEEEEEEETKKFLLDLGSLPYILSSSSRIDLQGDLLLLLLPFYIREGANPLWYLPSSSLFDLYIFPTMFCSPELIWQEEEKERKQR